MFFGKSLHDLIITLAYQFRVFLNRDPVLVHMEGIEGVFLRYAFDNNGLYSQSGKKLGGIASSVTLLNGAGEGTFAAG